MLLPQRVAKNILYTKIATNTAGNCPEVSLETTIVVTVTNVEMLSRAAATEHDMRHIEEMSIWYVSYNIFECVSGFQKRMLQSFHFGDCAANAPQKPSCRWKLCGPPFIKHILIGSIVNNKCSS